MKYVKRILLFLFITAATGCGTEVYPKFDFTNTDIVPIKVYVILNDDLNYLKNIASPLDPSLVNDSVIVQEESHSPSFENESNKYILFGIIDTANEFKYLIFENKTKTLYIAGTHFVKVFLSVNAIYISPNPDIWDDAKDLLVFKSGDPK